MFKFVLKINRKEAKKIFNIKSFYVKEENYKEMKVL
jgi:hypothetical protein